MLIVLLINGAGWDALSSYLTMRMMCVEKEDQLQSVRCYDGLMD